MKQLAKLFSLLILVFVIHSCTMQKEKEGSFPEPFGDDEAEMQQRKLKYFELMHRSAPGTDWRAAEVINREMALKAKQNNLRQRGGSLRVASAQYANGIITGSWQERGSRNIAGNVRYMDYVPSTNIMYLISDGGTLWKGNATLGNWEVLNQNKKFIPNILKVTGNGAGSQRILAAADQNMFYSDDDGTNFTPAAGISFPVAWGGNSVTTIAVMNDASQTVYCLTRPWDPLQGAERYWLYRSADHGATYTKIYSFDFGDDNQLSLYSPYGSADLYALDVNSPGSQSTLYSISGTMVTVINNSTDMPVNVNCVLKGYKNGASNIFYALNNNNKVFKSVNNGLNWTLQSDLPENSWDRLEVSVTNPNQLYFGGVNAYRSANGGISWRLVTGGWAAYYGNQATRLHADIMQVQSFLRADNTEFTAVTCHGGYYISYDSLKTVSNKSLLNLNTAQTWDVLTDRNNSDAVYIGAQDQGFQVGTGAVNTNGSMDFVQAYSGDYGQLALTDSLSKLWIEYPGGDISLYANPAAITAYRAPDAGKKVLGTQKPNYGWMLPTANTGSLLSNELLVGGGNMTGGDGSYLIKFKLQQTPQLAIVDSQYAFDFRANSNNGTSGISAIEASLISGRIFVATEDGTFFNSPDKGANWLKTTGFSAPSGFWLYGACILASQLNENVVWYAGSGYSNSAVYKSADGGATFTSMNTGLPPTLVHKIVATPDEQLLFAATEAGPYVYVTATGEWYSLMAAETPVQDYFTVEYVPDQKIARFGTYGRGIWDFKVESAKLDKYICPGSSITYSAGLAAADYQWQVDDGSGFTNLSNNINYSGVNAADLQIKNIPASFSGYRYRCNTGNGAGTAYTLKVTVYWKGGVSKSWENPFNWNCGVLPDANTDVIVNIEAPNLPEINSTAVCRSINVSPGSALKVNIGGKLTVTH